MATMAHPATTEEDSQLIADLHRLAKKNSKLVKSTTHQAPGDPNVTVRSWKMNEHKYYDVPSPFPSLARGIFTTEPVQETDNQDGRASTPGGTLKYRIAIRGYDKFFNIGEVPWTTWQAIEEHTVGPYNLSLKSNGCIIFIGALSPTKLLITSKHSLGPVDGKGTSHAQAGEGWLRKYLAQKGRTEEDLAGVLWKNNWTAISELCDDSFEEHVLPYPPERTGLHLHGINECTKAFRTLPQSVVDDFAEEWGFLKTLSATVDTVTEVRDFMTEAAKKGEWKGEAVEGFVVRTHVSEPVTVQSGKNSGQSPYAPGSTFFFKVKFDEPYMMYRDWREVTRMLLHSKGAMTASSLPKSKMKRPETKLYVRWVIEEIKKDRKSFDQFGAGKGIIATRERFLKWFETQKGTKELEDIQVEKADATSFGKTIIVPVAIPGCGKTTVAVALAKIFGFGHTQSDDVRAKKPAPVFIKKVVGLLGEFDVVIADKNNHLTQHRTQLREATENMSPPVRLLALNWSLDKPRSTIHRICGDRVLVRGDNHQSLHGDSKTMAHEDVIWQFITNSQELAPAEVDATIEMDLEDSLEQAIQRAVDGCVSILGLPKPSQETVDAAVAAALGYSPKIKKDDKAAPAKKVAGPRYFGLLPEIDISSVLADKLGEGNVFWKHLLEQKRVTDRPHVTVVHQKALPDEQLLWDRCSDLHKIPSAPSFEFSLGNVVWNDRIMAVTIEDLRLAPGEGDESQEGSQFLSMLPDEVRNRLHITVGTSDSNVAPVEAKDLVERWRKGEQKAESIKLEGVVVKGRIKGLFA
ncbi:RNA ligase-domain-containing protein [Mycena floridula]|nr:RNA ligase-domain-containing protein [Mycena floridula]